MTVKEYLKDHCKIDQSYIASKMWPNNSNASAYLSRKLNDKGRPFTKSDAEKAMKVLSEEILPELSNELKKLTLE
ncbi:hypothetical protein [Chryseobacterium vrystaatense]|uniref:Uncharacterized protein n=1 Tax=Chryseobacterium vrystaatense TaxID=307480 RepID=A0A1M4ZM84_9FLAO|nr:hypothetical protein [Chryseobacterium vrystaatense]SHF19114.1 hypothetical protein SAMN02787073_1641 [Chryseobacterium vrystaatense]